MKKVTIEDVAKKAGVSKGTISAVINAKNSVKPQTRDNILSVMKEFELSSERRSKKFKKWQSGQKYRYNN